MKKNISLKKYVKFCTFYSMVLKSTDIALNKLIFTALKLKKRKKENMYPSKNYSFLYRVYKVRVSPITSLKK